jgi:hypothetical protein
VFFHLLQLVTSLFCSQQLNRFSSKNTFIKILKKLKFKAINVIQLQLIKSCTISEEETQNSPIIRETSAVIQFSKDTILALYRLA